MAIFFEWDEEKARINKRKHGVSFSAARAVFMDPFRFTTEDSVVDGEQRWRTIGLAGGIALLLVVHLEELAGDDVFIRDGRLQMRGEDMSKIVRMTSEDPLTSEDLDELRKLAAMPADQIDTSDIPEKPLNLELALKRRREGWRPGVVRQKKAS